MFAVPHPLLPAQVVHPNFLTLATLLSSHKVIAYLAGLQHSGLYRPSLVVCPATVLRQWLRELRTWWPRFRVVLLHDSGRSPPGAPARPNRCRGLLQGACGRGGSMGT